MTNAFDDLFGGPFRPRTPATPSKPKLEKGVQIHGHKIEGQFYVRAADVVALLEANDVLPGVAEKLRRADR